MYNAMLQSSTSNSIEMASAAVTVGEVIGDGVEMRVDRKAERAKRRIEKRKRRREKAAGESEVSFIS